MMYSNNIDRHTSNCVNLQLFPDWELQFKP
jgi:hypothetical protein